MSGHNVPNVSIECYVLKFIDFIHLFIKNYIINTSKGHVLFHVTSEGLKNELAIFT